MQFNHAHLDTALCRLSIFSFVKAPSVIGVYQTKSWLLSLICSFLLQVKVADNRVIQDQLEEKVRCTVICSSLKSSTV